MDLERRFVDLSRDFKRLFKSSFKIHKSQILQTFNFLKKMTTFEFVCPPAPAHWDKSNDYKLHKRVSEFLSVALEPVGHEYMARAKRHTLGRTIAEEYEMEAALLDANAEDLATEDDEPESAKLLRSNPSNWKVRFVFF